MGLCSDEYYNIVEFTGAGTRRDVVIEELQQQQQQRSYCIHFILFHLPDGPAASASVIAQTAAPS